MIHLWVWRLSVLGAIMAVPLFLVVCAGDIVPSYRAVGDVEPDPRPDFGERINTGRTMATFTPDYVVRDGKLYLRVRVVHFTPILTGLSDTNWDEARIRAFRARHPELEEYWPDPKRPDGGVRWLRP